MNEILIIVGVGEDYIINYFDSNKMDEIFSGQDFENLHDIYFVWHKFQKGLADAIRYAEKVVDGEPFAVLVDTIY